MHAWQCQSPAARVLISDKLILDAQVIKEWAVLQRGVSGDAHAWYQLFLPNFKHSSLFSLQHLEVDVLFGTCIVFAYNCLYIASTPCHIGSPHPSKFTSN